MRGVLIWLGIKVPVLLCALAIMVVTGSLAHATDACDQYRPSLVREAQAVYGLAAPVPMFAAQLRQESSCRASITAWDNGRGLAQFMDDTSKQVARMYPEIGAPDPYSPKWAIRALVRYDGWLHKRVRGDTECERWGAALKGYNGGLGYVLKAQRLSTTSGAWFGATEDINAGQSAQNFDYSRRYPHLILFQHQRLYTAWGSTVCLESQR